MCGRWEGVLGGKESQMTEGLGLLAKGCELHRKQGATDKEMRLDFRKVAERKQRRAWDHENRGSWGGPC